MPSMTMKVKVNQVNHVLRHAHTTILKQTLSQPSQLAFLTHIYSTVSQPRQPAFMTQIDLIF